MEKEADEEHHRKFGKYSRTPQTQIYNRLQSLTKDREREIFPRHGNISHPKGKMPVSCPTHFSMVTDKH